MTDDDELFTVEYEKLLTRAYELIPSVPTTTERFKLPEPDVVQEGRNTIIRNFAEISDALNRQTTHILGYLCRELGTAGYIDGRRALLKGIVNTKSIEEKLESYVEIFVYCGECHRPDTRLVKEDRTLLLECSACGALRAVRARKAVKPESIGLTIVTGGTYEILVEDVDVSGDGLARIGKYKIYIRGAAKGARVRVRIEKISGTTAYAKIVK